MSEYDQTFDPNILKGHCDLISWFSDSDMWSYFFHSMFVYDKTFDPKLVLDHCDLVSWFSDFALYLDTRYIFILLSDYG